MKRIKSSLLLICLLIAQQSLAGIVSDVVQVQLMYSGSQISTESAGPGLVDIIGDFEIISDWLPVDYAYVSSTVIASKTVQELGMEIAVRTGTSPKGAPIYESARAQIKLENLTESSLNQLVVENFKDERVRASLTIDHLQIVRKSKDLLSLKVKGVAVIHVSSVSRPFELVLDLEKRH